jgi:hypothetical protein
MSLFICLFTAVAGGQGAGAEEQAEEELDCHYVRICQWISDGTSRFCA